MASLLTRGSDPVDLSVKAEKSTLTITIKGKGWNETIVLTDKLTPAEE